MNPNTRPSRPSIEKKPKKRVFVGARVTPEEYAALLESAAKNNRSISGELRHRVIAALAA